MDYSSTYVLIFQSAVRYFLTRRLICTIVILISNILWCSPNVRAGVAFGELPVEKIIMPMGKSRRQAERVGYKYGKLCHRIGVFWHMPYRFSFAASAERRRGKRAEASDYHYVQLPCTECGVYAGTDGDHTGGGHDGDHRGECGFRLCDLVLLLVYLYLLLYVSAENIFEISWNDQFSRPAFGIF